MTLTIQQFSKEYTRDCLDIIKRVVTDGFVESGIDIEKEKSHLENELRNQRDRIHAYANHYFLALGNTHLIGMIAYLDPCDAVHIAAKQLDIPITLVQEIVAVYVHPDFQRKGVGSALFSHMGGVFRKQHIPYFAVSTGYVRGKSFWTKKLGRESVILSTYYEGTPCHVWIRPVGDIL